MAELDVIVCVAFDPRSDAQGLERFKKCICQCDFVEVAMEVSGTFDMIVHGKIETLSAYNDHMERLRPQLAEFVTRIEANFVGKKMERKASVERCLWVPCAGGRRRIDVGMIDKVAAEGDYVRLFIRDWHCLIHSTIRALKEKMDDRFIQLHRSAIVRIDFIDRLLHQDRRWTARLLDGSQQPVSKSRVAELLDLMVDASASNQQSFGPCGTVVELAPQANQMRVRAAR